MGALGTNQNQKSTIPEAQTQAQGLGDIGAAVHAPRFMAESLMDLGICKTQEDLDEAKKALADYKKVVQLTKQKFAIQKSAADMAYDLAKSQNELVSYLAKTVMKQAKSDAEIASLLQALPQMLSAISGTVAEKKEAKVRNFTERLNAAGKGKTTATQQ